MLQAVLLVILIFVCAALVGVILLQRSEGGALGMGGGPSGFMSTRGVGDLLTRTTSILAGVFFVLCLALTLIIGRAHRGDAVVDRLKIEGLDPAALARRQAAQQPAAPANTPAPAVPVPGAPILEAPKPGSILLPPAPSAAAPSIAAPSASATPTRKAAPAAPKAAKPTTASPKATPAPAASAPAPAPGPAAAAPTPAPATPAPATPAPNTTTPQ